MSIKIPKKFSRGGVLSADRVNEIIDCLEELAKSCDSDEVKAGAGLKETPYGNGGKVLSLVNFSKGGAISAKSTGSSSGGSLNFPFKASIDGNILTIAKGYVLVKPNSISYGGADGGGLKFSQSEFVTKQKISVPVKTYEFEAKIPESELQYVAAVNSSQSGTVKAAFNIAIPTYEASSVTETNSFTVTTGVSFVTELHSVLTTVHMMDAILNTGSGSSTTEVLVHVGEIDDCTERLSITVGSSGTASETVEVKSLSGVTLNQTGSESVAVSADIPIYEIATELMAAPWITGGELKEGETETAEVDADISSQVYAPEAAEFTGGSESLSGDEKDSVYFLEVPEYSAAVTAGTVVLLKVNLEDGDGATFEWETSTLDEIAAKGYWTDKEKRQAAEIVVKGELTSESENPVFGISVAVTGSGFFNAEGLFPIAAALSSGDSEETLSAYQLHFGVLNYTPPLDLSLNYSGGSTEGTVTSLKDLTSHNDLSEGAIFPIENSELREAMGSSVKEGEE